MQLIGFNPMFIVLQGHIFGRLISGYLTAISLDLDQQFQLVPPIQTNNHLTKLAQGGLHQLLPHTKDTSKLIRPKTFHHCKINHLVR